MIDRRTFALALVGVCVLSAGIGASVTIFAKTGPPGPRGPAGPEGPPGDSAEDASYEASIALDRLDSLELEVEELESRLPAYGTAANEDQLYSLEGDLAELSGEVEVVERKLSELCRGLELIC